ncbi:MAG: YraN family protein [Paracoccaceae bacterium]|nr:YraN family protein [Paracoccaceae bacterium]
MPFDCAPRDDKRHAGTLAYQSGLAAEASVARVYEAMGYEPLETRWRGILGEVDLIFQGQGEVIFVEVKKARTCELAATRLSLKQLNRIAHAATEYIGTCHSDPLSPMRLDLAMVDETGHVELLENLTLY